MNTKNITRFFKGLAIFMVILCHSHQTFDLPYSLNKVFSFFQIGVQAFMLLSAMGLCFSYNKKPLGWFAFMKKRLSKIVILFWFAIALAAVYRVAYAFVMNKNILLELNPLGIFVNSLLLHGFSPDNTINNAIVRGGWFIGSIVILYALFPLLYRLYFSENTVWKKSRMYLFPLGALILSSTVILFKIPDILHTHTKTLLQLVPFSLGFPLFELQKNDTLSRIKIPFVKGVLFTAIAVVLYFTETTVMNFYIFSIALAFFYFIIFVLRNGKIVSAIGGKSPICRFFNVLGEYSFPIYLTHSYIAFDFCAVATAVLSRIYPSELLWFILLQPFVFALSFYFSKIFDIVVNFIVSKLKKA